MPVFRPRGAVSFDRRNLTWKGVEAVSVLTLDGRTLVPVKMGDWQKVQFRNVRGEFFLHYRRGRFYLVVVVEEPEPPLRRAEGVLGVDLGIVNLAVDSDGNIHKGDCVDQLRVRTERLKASLQRRGTKSARRHMRKVAGKESRFRKHMNHVISKELVARAKGTRRAIALEELEGVCSGRTVPRPQRRRQFSWAYRQLRRFITYKAKRAGVPVIPVPPQGTSRQCPRCRYEASGNRKSRVLFECRRCGLAGPADYIAAVNIAARAAVDRPIVPRSSVGGLVLPQGQAVLPER
jgi:IS605 OrfB family transposase